MLYSILCRFMSMLISGLDFYKALTRAIWLILVNWNWSSAYSADPIVSITFNFTILLDMGSRVTKNWLNLKLFYSLLVYIYIEMYLFFYNIIVFINIRLFMLNEQRNSLYFYYIEYWEFKYFQAIDISLDLVLGNSSYIFINYIMMHIAQQSYNRVNPTVFHISIDH